MRHVTFFRPNLGDGRPSDAMTPLVFAILRALTPPEIETTLIDERVEPFAPVPTDLVAMTVETFTARRAWEIADAYRARGVPVVVGGHHPSMVPEEAEAHADAVVIGDGEAVWPEILADAAAGRLKPRYEAAPGTGPRPMPDRSIFAGRRYAPVSLVQVGRGCRFACDFCSIHAFYGTHREQRPVAEVVAEIETLPAGRMIFFVDDNLLFRRDRFEALMRELAPLKRRWSCQISIDVARDDRLLDLMADAGCALVLIGFESLRPDNLKQMRKNWNGVAGPYEDVIARLRARGIMLYGTFVFGYDADRAEDFETTARFAEAMGMAIANFNPLTPMPGTGLITRLAEEGRLLRPTWWLDPAYRYGDAIFRPAAMSAEALRDGPMAARSIFYRAASIARRALRGLPRWGLVKTALMLLANIVSRREIARKQAAPLAAARDGKPAGEEATCGSP